MSGDLLSLLLANVDRNSPPPILVSGPVGAGKTTSCQDVLPELRRRSIRPGGILSPRICKGSETVGYSVQDLEDGEIHEFASTDPPGISIGRYYLSPSGLQFALQSINRATTVADVVFVDEVGRLELQGDGLASGIYRALQSESLCVLLTRSGFRAQLIRQFEIDDWLSWKVK